MIVKEKKLFYVLKWSQTAEKNVLTILKIRVGTNIGNLLYVVPAELTFVHLYIIYVYEYLLPAV